MMSVGIALLCFLAGLALALLVFSTQSSRSQSQHEQHLHQTPDTGEIAARERERIYQDIHDDIGSKLLTLLHTTKDSNQADLIRSVMQDLRDVVSRSETDGAPLLQVLGQIREETERRLHIAGGQVLWEVGTDLPDPHLSAAQALHLFRISREAVTNALRHGGARRLRIRARCNNTLLLLDYTDDSLLSSNEVRQAIDTADGAGIRNMRARACELQGQVNWTQGSEGGIKVVLEFPLPP